jgi:hypothetical protein
MSNPYSRKSKEAEKVDLFFASIVNRFHQAMFGVDHDDPKTPNVDIFSLFNRAWVHFATEWNKKAKKTGANVKAFEDYAINQDLE